jgi:hypothetical protein
MEKTLKNLVTSLSIAGVTLTVFATTSLAATITISGNGADSTNTADVDLTSTTAVSQTNTSTFTNVVTAIGRTGRNTASNNGGSGDVTIDTGDVENDITISNTGGGNWVKITKDPLAVPDVEIKNNLGGSTNTAPVTLTDTTAASQSNSCGATNVVTKKGRTGRNRANDNLGSGEVKIKTGKVTNTGGATNICNPNTLEIL